jgi:Flp pilus assembly protein TadG
MAKKTFYQFLVAERGVAAIEFAFIFPFMIALYFGMIDLTQLITFNRKATTISDSVASLIGQNRTRVEETDLKDYYNVAKLVMFERYGDLRINVAVFRETGGALVPTWNRTNSRGPTCGALPTIAELTPLAVVDRDLIVVQSCFKFRPYTGFIGQTMLGAGEFLVEQTAIQTPRTTPGLCINRTGQNPPCS